MAHSEKASPGEFFNYMQTKSILPTVLWYVKDRYNGNPNNIEKKVNALVPDFDSIHIRDNNHRALTRIRQLT